VGKSESALELVKRGHQLVADDVVDVRRVTDQRLVGEAPEMVRHFMEIRGIGIIDIRAMYGIGAVVRSKTIDLIIHLEMWVRDREYDRLGLTEEHSTIMGVAVPFMVIPVQPGRNLAIVIEVAARNHTLKHTGYNAAMELDRRLISMVSESAISPPRQAGDADWG
jgi:HPr kinase/phosphorylase